MEEQDLETGKLWKWIPTLYFSQGIPYVIVMTLSIIMYKKLGISNADIALYTSWLYLPFVIKPLWSPFVDNFSTKRSWIVLMELLIGSLFALVALTIPSSGFFQWTLAIFWLLAFSAATHDISSDGFYMLALRPHQQAAFVGVRSMFYRIAMIAGQGGLVYVAGSLTDATGNPTYAWSAVFVILAVTFFAAALYHQLILPAPVEDGPHASSTSSMGNFFSVFIEFFQKKNVLVTLAFLLLYRFGESQLVKMAAPFLLDVRDKGGLGLATQEVGVVYGTIGLLALTFGGVLSGYLVSRFGLKRMLWPMALSINVPHLVYVYLAFAQPGSFTLISTAVAIEQFGYGFGFTAFIMYMIMFSDGIHKTAHYAICTGFMALGMMLPGMASGWIQEKVGYSHFFVWICICAIPSLLATSLLKIDPAFGRKKDAAEPAGK